jgi:spermidine synthase
MASNVKVTDSLHTTAPPLTAEPVTTWQRWLWQPNLIVFVSSACIMVLELVAGRIVAPYVGVSLYTWTSIIGVVLAGISLGNYIGGLLADRWASLRFLGAIFVLAGVSSLSVLLVDFLGTLNQEGWPIVLEILVLTTALFFVPCTILGTISPVVAKLAVRDLARTGRTVGQIYAAGTVGSILGTFATGFILISRFGTYTIVWSVAAILFVLGALFLFAGRWLPLGLMGLLVVAGSWVAVDQGWLEGKCTQETNYFCIKIKEEEREGEPVKVLILDRLVHSYTSIDNPTKLVYGYEQIYAEATAYQAAQSDQLRALFIGGGGYTFPRYIEALYPGSDIHVIEIDPGVTRIAYEQLGVKPDTTIVSYNEDARLFLEREPTQSYNLIMGDAFNDFSVPYHLTTKEFNDRVHAWLAPDGLYMVNIIDGVRGDFLRAYIHTLRQTFSHVYLIPAIPTWRTASRTTFVLIATDTPLDLGRVNTFSQGHNSRLVDNILSEAEMDALLAEDELVLLTDQYAPVDQMLTPVFRGEVER